MTLRLEWDGSGRRPQQPPNPDYPNGCVLDAGGGRLVTCRAELPYPAESIGTHTVICEECRTRVRITAASRPDDPREVILACGAHCAVVKRPWVPT